MAKRLIKIILIVPAIFITGFSFPVLVLIWAITGNGEVFDPDKTILMKLIYW